MVSWIDIFIVNALGGLDHWGSVVNITFFMNKSKPTQYSTWFISSIIPRFCFQRNSSRFSTKAWCWRDRPVIKQWIFNDEKNEVFNFVFPSFLLFPRKFNKIKSSTWFTFSLFDILIEIVFHFCKNITTIFVWHRNICEQ